MGSRRNSRHDGGLVAGVMGLRNVSPMHGTNEKTGSNRRNASPVLGPDVRPSPDAQTVRRLTLDIPGPSYPRATLRIYGLQVIIGTKTTVVPSPGFGERYPMGVEPGAEERTA